jgi:SAM-dependent methyltransferase
MEAQRLIDEINAGFYGRFQYPPPPATFERVVQAGFARKMLAQDLGYWRNEILPDAPRVWVAGCGTNQAVVTALKFPEAQVVGSDLSSQSLDRAAETARQLGLQNLELRRESINEAPYSSEFDMVISTGVIHHNAKPKAALRRLAAAMKPGGVLELMVYNKFHRILTAAFQGALRILAGTEARPSWQDEMNLARLLAASFRRGNLMSAFLSQNAQAPDTLFADSLLQPIEHSYTIGSLRQMTVTCGLELLTFCIDPFSRSTGAVNWNLDFQEPVLRERYQQLGDIERWEVTNLLLGEASPMLWFYLQRADSPHIRKSERDICDGFLRAKFRRAATEKEVFSRAMDGAYSPAPKRAPFPGKPKPGSEAARVYAALEEGAELSQTLERLGIEQSFLRVQSLRLELATSAYPFLEACGD